MYTVLIAEDYKSLKNNLQNLLFDKSYIALLAENGAKAYSIALQYLHEILISDSVIYGYDLCEQIKNNEATSRIPLVISTEKIIKDLTTIMDHK